MIKKRSKVTLKAREFDRHKPQWNLSDSGEILFDEAALKSLRAKKYAKKIASKLEKKVMSGVREKSSGVRGKGAGDIIVILNGLIDESQDRYDKGAYIIQRLDDMGYEIVQKDNSSWYRK